jgi:6-pyruvoyltetrahydropterin/6-carboxytetrahydropterin synthase
MSTEITRRLEIDMGHRLLAHEGKCANYHGHRYVFDITCTAAALDRVGRIVDFSVVKQLVGGWIDENLDHGMILQRGDPMIRSLILMQPGVVGSVADEQAMRIHQLASPRLLIVDYSPTAENIARLVFARAADLLAPHGVRVTRVRCWETPNCWADYTAPAASPGERVVVGTDAPALRTMHPSEIAVLP